MISPGGSCCDRSERVFPMSHFSFLKGTSPARTVQRLHISSLKYSQHHLTLTFHHLFTFIPVNSILAGSWVGGVELKPFHVCMLKSNAKIIKSPAIYLPSPIPIHCSEHNLNGALSLLCNLKLSSHLTNFLQLGMFLQHASQLPQKHSSNLGLRDKEGSWYCRNVKDSLV
jgi:hypothetical protein